MTDITTADGLEKRLRRHLAMHARQIWRENGGGFHGPHVEHAYIEDSKLETALVAIVTDAMSDALAKARVALEAVQWIPDGPSGNLSCSACGAGKPGHNPRCPIGAALEAMK